MKEWMLAISVGPVGAFIGGGRRSRDLWWGSTWVSECALEVATVLNGQGTLIVPSPSRYQGVQAKRKEQKPGRAREHSAYGGRISNRVLARVQAKNGGEVEQLARACERAVHLRLAEEVAASRARIEKKKGVFVERALQAVLDARIFEDQVRAIEEGDFVEFYAAWAVVEEGSQKAQERAMELLDARKNTRLFTAPSSPKAGHAKSDLDPGRDSVLKTESAPGGIPPQRARQRLGIRPDEALDAVSFARRIATFTEGPQLEPLPFPPLGRVAADAWLLRVAQDAATKRDFLTLRNHLEAAYEEAKLDQDDNSSFFAWCSPAKDLNPERKEVDSTFPFDGAFLFEGGLEALAKDLGRKGDQDPTLRQIEAPVRALHQVHGFPSPYYALLAMDGDGVGRVLQDAGLEDLDGLVAALDTFADHAEGIIKTFRGCAFYVGGDDVMAYLPLDQAPAAALALAELFEAKVGQVFRHLAKVSLSGGLVIAHAKSDLRAIRSVAQEALKNAKRQRLAQEHDDQEGANRAWLEVRELPRAGPARKCAGPLSRLVEALSAWGTLHTEGRLSHRIPHQLFELHQQLAGEEDTELSPELAIHRVIAQMRRSGSDEVPAPIKARLKAVANWQQVEALANELRIAVRFARERAVRPPMNREEQE